VTPFLEPTNDAYRQVKSRLDLAVSDMGLTQLKNIAEPVRVYSLEVGKPTEAHPGVVIYSSVDLGIDVWVARFVYAYYRPD
jgi:hypothetical protein